MPADRPNVAVVVLDTLRKDAFDWHFDWLPGRRFDHAYSPADFTTPAHGSLFTGRYPTEHGARARARGLAPEHPTLAERLRERGYRTRCLTANPHVSAEYGFVRGFDEVRAAWQYDDFADVCDWGQLGSRLAHLPTPLRHATAVLDCATGDARTVRSLRHALAERLSFVGDGTARDKSAGSVVEALDALPLDSAGEFLFLNLMELHDPYVAPEAYLPDRVEKPSIVDQVTGDVPPATARRVRAAYDACAAYLSDVYREIFAALRREFDYVVTTSDHGHALGDDGAWGHGYGVHPAVTHVPLCLTGPDAPRSRTDVTASLLDVHRTVLDLAGAPPAGRGRNLLSLTDDEPVLAESHGLYWNRIEALRVAGFTDEEIDRHDALRRGVAVGNGYYGYQTVDGFRERTVGTRPDDPETLLAGLADALDPAPATAAGEPSPELRAHLEELGYR
jgi:arylsulfatase